MRSTHYNSPIDTWACGCIMAELFSMGALFPGTSEADQVYKICSVLGTPTAETWPEGLKLAAQMQFRYPPFVPTPLAQLIPNASYEALALLSDLIQFDPYRRPTASQALQYSFFQANATLAPAVGQAKSGVGAIGFQAEGGDAVDNAQNLVRQPSLANAYKSGGTGFGKVGELYDTAEIHVHNAPSKLSCGFLSHSASNCFKHSRACLVWGLAYIVVTLSRILMTGLQCA